jgi:catechol 2,3-dioxygenase-like lactoylglutathione lyase family enzyme
MAQGARLGSAVMFVQDLDRSVSFYEDVLGLEVADRSTTAALLVSGDGAQLVLRATGATGAHALGGVGIQYVIWAADGEAGARHAEQALRARSVLVGTRASGEVTVVQGRDPDNVMVMIAHPGPDQALLAGLPAWIYGW